LPSPEGEFVIVTMIESLRQVLARTEGTVALVLVNMVSKTQASTEISPRSRWLADRLKAEIPSLDIQLAGTRVVVKQELGYVAISQLRY